MRTPVDTALESLRGCTCAGGPSYYTSFRDRSGRTIKGPRIKNRRVAEAALRELQVELDDKGRVGWTEERNIEFPGWVDEYETILDRRVRNGDLKAETPRSYLDTLRRIAIPAIGYRNVRAIGMPELRNFDDAIGPVAASSRQKHFRQLSACLATAVDEGYADRNPVSTYRRKYLRGTRTPKQGSGPFTDGELARLWPALEHGEPVYLSVCQFAVATGLRQGELIALDWQDIDLLETEIHVRHTWNPRDGLTAPKDKEERTVELTQPAIEILSRWMTQPQSGSHEHGPVFCPPRGERLEQQLSPSRARRRHGRCRNPKGRPLDRAQANIPFTASNIHATDARAGQTSPVGRTAARTFKSRSHDRCLRQLESRCREARSSRGQVTQAGSHGLRTIFDTWTGRAIPVGQPAEPTAFDLLPLENQEQAWRARFHHLAARWQTGGSGSHPAGES